MRMSLAVIALAALCALPAACKQRESDPDADAPTFDAGSDASADTSGAGGAGLKPLALGCSDGAECASGFCVDGVCCDSACDGQCSTCDVTGNAGYCTSQIYGDDTTSAETCTGAHTCAIAIPPLNLPACRLKNLQACKGNADCASLLCETFYVDRDGDGFGQSNKTISFCEVQGATPPTGYVTQGADCCDNDANAFPGQTKYFGSPDGCGGWDYNCDGTVQGSSGFVTYATVPTSECGTTAHGSCDSCTDTIECH